MFQQLGGELGSYLTVTAYETFGKFWSAAADNCPF